MGGLLPLRPFLLPLKGPPKNKKPRNSFKLRGIKQNGAGEETRTLDVHLGKVVLYQLSYACLREVENKNYISVRQ